MSHRCVVSLFLGTALALLSGCGAGGGGAAPAGGGGGGGNPPAVTPTLIRNARTSPGNIIVDATAQILYWVDFRDGTLTAVPTNGSSGVIFSSPSAGAPVFDVVQDSLSVFVSYSAFGAANSIPMILKIQKPATVGIAGTIIGDRNHVEWPPMAQRLPAFGLPTTGITPSGMTISNSSPGVLYFADTWASGIGSFNVNGGPVSVVYDNGTGGAGALACLASDSVGIYATPFGANAQNIRYHAYNGTLMGSAGPYTSVFALVTYQPGGSSSAAGDLFFIEESTHNLYQVQIVGSLGGSRTLLATNAGSGVGARALAVDSTGVYFITQGRIARVPIATAPGAPLATPQILVTAAQGSNPVSLAMDASKVYWTASGTGPGNGFVYSMPKN